MAAATQAAGIALLDVPSTRTVLGGRAFAVAGPRTWNSLPAVVRSAFKKHLKLYLFRCAYDTAQRILFILFHLLFYYFIVFIVHFCIAL